MASALPIGNEEIASSSPYGTRGTRQEFLIGTVYSSKHGAYYILDEDGYEDEGGSAGLLGFPIREAEIELDSGRFQQFEGGVFYTDGKASRVSFAVRPNVIEALSDKMFRPISKEAAAESSSGALGRAQRFVLRHHGQWKETAIYSLADGATMIVPTEIWSYYSKLGAEKSWLGFPTPGKQIMSDSRGGQIFEEGAIYWRSEEEPITVPAAVIKLVGNDPHLRGRLGFPVSEEQPVGADGSGRIQYFEYGVITLRDGKRETWLRPERPRKRWEGLPPLEKGSTDGP